MRITGGTAGGRTLRVPKGVGVRPTPDRVRQAIFNSLGDFVQSARVLEIFGGSGALSLECLSRGAVSAACIELSSRHARFIRENGRSLGVDSRKFSVKVSDAFAAIAQFSAGGGQFDLIMADPPFGEKVLGTRSKSYSQRVLDDSNLPGLVAAGGVLVLGHAKRDRVSVPAPWEELKLLKHGDSMFRILVVASPAREQPLLEPVE